MEVVRGKTLDTVVNILQKSRYNGLTFVIICAHVDVEEHYTQLQGNILVPLSLPMVVAEDFSHIDS